MRAEIIRDDEGYTATFARTLSHPPGKVWEMLTANEKLKQWFPELSMEELESGGNIQFDKGNGTFENGAILEFEEGKVLGFEWGEEEVRFEIQPDNGNTRLFLIETISRIMPQTAKDLAGWHVCLDVIQAHLDGTEIMREEVWEKELPEYQRLLDSLTGSLG